MNKLAIGITTYNNADNIENICDIYNTPEVSVYVVDDYSTDGTVELLKAKNIDCKLPPEKMGAPGAARNMIVQQAIEAGNKFIAFIDGDDAAILENLSLLAKNINPKYDMYYTPMLVRGYNEALIPLGVSNFIHTGKVTTKKLLTKKFARLRYELLLGSGGRVYNLDVINRNKLMYDPNKSGQDSLFNHQYFEHIKNVYFNDVTKPYYIYDIQMDSLSNNYKLDVLQRRLILINEISKFPYTIHTNKEYADKAFHRYTSTYFMEENAKAELANILTDFVGEEYNYVASNDYLKQIETIPKLKTGINVVLVNCQLEVPDNDLLNVIELSEITKYDQVAHLLTHTKTIILDRSIYQVDFNCLLEMLESDADIIQPKYVTVGGASAQRLNDELYHGFSNDGFSSTYTYVGMLYKTELLLKFDFSFFNHYELLTKSLFLNVVIPKVYNTTGFYMQQREFTRFYQRHIVDTFNRSYFSNTRGKIVTYSKLMAKPIIKGSFAGVKPSYQSQNLSYEDQSFVETELLEFPGFEGAYFVDGNNNLVESTSNASEINFDNMIFGKRVPAAKTMTSDKVLINIPVNYKLSDCKMIKFGSFAVGVKKGYNRENQSKSVTYLQFNTDVVKTGDNKEFIKLVREDGLIFDKKSAVIPAGKYQFLIDQTNIQYLDKFVKVEFENKQLYNKLRKNED